MNYPNYSKSLLSLISSILVHYGVETEHSTFDKADELLSKNPKNVVVMLFDGMGENIIKKHLSPDAFLIWNQKDVISSVFPPTTTSATTTMLSGLSPIEHGWLGWTLKFDEIGKNVCVFPNTEFLKDEQAEEYNVAKKFIPFISVFERISASTSGRVKAECVSAFTEYKADSAEKICKIVKKLCAEDGEKYIYTYFNQPDHNIHDFGVDSRKVGKQVKKINRLVEKMSKRLHDTLLFVIADHGLVDIEWKYLTDYPEICDCLSDYPSIEPRVLSFFVKQDKKDVFEREFEKAFSGEFELLTKEQVFENHVFGFGKEHPKAKDFVGDYLAIAKGKTAINVVRPDVVFKGMHAGQTADEYNVPFIAIELE